MPEIQVHTKKDPKLENSKYKDRAYISQKLADKHNLSKKQHIRVDNPRKNKPNLSTYYRIWRIKENLEHDFVIHPNSLGRFNAVEGQKIQFSKSIPNRETKQEAREKGGVYEELKDDGRQDKILITAVHGGSIDGNTHKMADQCFQHLKEKGVPVSLWKLQGYVNCDQERTAHRTWHFSMVSKSKNSYNYLNEIKDRGFSYIAGFHRLGYTPSEVGGTMSKGLRGRVAEELEDRTGKGFETDKEEMGNVGDSSMVTENYLAESGGEALHLECSPSLCKYYHGSVGRGVADVLLEKFEK